MKSNTKSSRSLTLEGAGKHKATEIMSQQKTKRVKTVTLHHGANESSTTEPSNSIPGVSTPQRSPSIIDVDVDIDAVKNQTAPENSDSECG